MLKSWYVWLEDIPPPLDEDEEEFGASLEEAEEAPRWFLASEVDSLQEPPWDSTRIWNNEQQASI